METWIGVAGALRPEKLANRRHILELLIDEWRFSFSRVLSKRWKTVQSCAETPDGDDVDFSC